MVLHGFELVDPKTGDHKVVGDLAESWEMQGDTGVVFRLRNDVRWHDGQPVTARHDRRDVEGDGIHLGSVGARPRCPPCEDDAR